MRINEREVNFLCKASEFHSLIGFDRLPMLSKNDVEKAMDSLKKKKIIQDHKLSSQGLALVKILHLYNQAKKFIKIGNANFANYQDQEYVMIKKEQEDFIIEAVNQDQIVVSILGKLSAEWKDVEEGSVKKKLMSKNMFIEYMKKHEDQKAIYYYHIDLERETERSAVLFVENHRLQHYDALKEELILYPKEEIQKGIEKIFE